MPFGLVNAMAVWSRFIDTIMDQYRYKFVLCYADDCLVYTKTDSLDDHLDDVQGVHRVARQRDQGQSAKIKVGGP